MTAVEQGACQQGGRVPVRSESPVPHEVGGFSVVDLQSAPQSASEIKVVVVFQPGPKALTENVSYRLGKFLDSSRVLEFG